MRHWLDLPRGRGPSQTPPSLATDSSISPGPPSPWLPALFTSAASQPSRHPWVPLTPAEPATPGASPPQGTCLAGSVSAANGLMQGCRGLRPRQNKLKVSPFPLGRGAGGWGKESKLKAGLTGDKEGKPPAGHPVVRQAAETVNNLRFFCNFFVLTDENFRNPFTFRRVCAMIMVAESFQKVSLS